MAEQPAGQSADAAKDSATASAGRIVFVSYASQDAPAANAVVGALEAAGIRSWIAPRDVVPGEFYAGAIVHAIDAAKAIVLVLSNRSAASQHVLREVERATSKKLPVISLRLDLAPLPADLEYFVNTSHWLDASHTGIEFALPALVDAVQRIVNGAVDPSRALARTSHESSADAGPVPLAGQARLRSVAAITLVTMIVVAVAYVAIGRGGFSKQAPGQPVAGVTGPITPPGAPVTPAISEQSIAVLPFTDMSEKHDQEYFSDGLSEELIDRLARIANLSVAARTSSFYFKGKPSTIPEIAKALGVSYVVEGSVRRVGSHVRVTAQLIRATTGYHLWSDSYDREVQDIFRVQDEITTAVSKALKVAIGPGLAAASSAPRSSDVNDLYLQARFISRQMARGSSDRTIALLRQALVRDPNFAPAWALLSRNLARLALDRQRQSADRRALIDEARAASRRATELAPSGAYGHLALGLLIEVFDKDYEAARREFELSLKLEPNSADALLQLAALARHDGDVADAIRLVRRAYAIDPLAPSIMLTLAETLLELGDGAQAEPVFRKVAELYPTNVSWRWGLSRALLLRHEYAAAFEIAEADASTELDHLENRAGFLPFLGRQAEADAALLRIEHECTAGNRDCNPVELASTYALRGDRERALGWLEKQPTQDALAVAGIDIDIAFIPLRGNPRFEAIRRKAGLPPWRAEIPATPQSVNR